MFEGQARNSVEDVYTKINRDLDEACMLLNGIQVNDINHYSEMVAWGLKARVALVMQDYDNAAAYAKIYNFSRTGWSSIDGR